MDRGNSVDEDLGAGGEPDKSFSGAGAISASGLISAPAQAGRFPGATFAVTAVSGSPLGLQSPAQCLAG